MDRYRNRVASFVKDVLDSDSMATIEEGEDSIKMKDKEARSTRQFLENLQGARMVASGQVAFKISD